jgi:hypothetical protein
VALTASYRFKIIKFNTLTGFVSWEYTLSRDANANGQAFSVIPGINTNIFAGGWEYDSTASNYYACIVSIDFS